ncbi:hypothetical protein OJF2_56230 [Aquisphaera giovannonii]|uniref:Uncharacterized protein n=1 Tax=Aquisphaera giovannonii TaxID=406548 RepID=A0A5B9W8W4_9BACT|nr:hypothetical protein [Aquisphaera giovannonii]QEH37038.1 hypothetical protein OJF2_56230 [Aquisphaera giovannonii]
MSHPFEAFPRFLSALKPVPSRAARSHRATPSLTALEGRIALSHFGAHAHVAAHVVAHRRPSSIPTGTTTGESSPGGTSSTQNNQLRTDLQQLQADVKAVLSASSVTDAQRQALNGDFAALCNAGVTVDRTALQAVATTLLTDIANGSYDANATSIQSSFTAAFSGTSGAALTGDQATLVNTAYGDFVTVAKGLNATTDQLTAIANDQTAIQADLTNLGLSTTNHPGQAAQLDLILGGPAGDLGAGGFRGPHGGFGHGHGRF